MQAWMWGNTNHYDAIPLAHVAVAQVHVHAWNGSENEGMRTRRCHMIDACNSDSLCGHRLVDLCGKLDELLRKHL